MAYAALLLAGGALAQTPTPSQTDAAKTVAVVDGTVITTAELDAALLSEPSPVTPTEKQKKQEQLRALQGLIDTVLVRKFLEGKTRAVSPEEVGRRLAEMEKGLAKQDKRLDDFLQETHKTLEQFKADIADHLRWNAYVNSQVKEADLEKYYQDNKAHFDGATVHVSHICIRLATTATDADRKKARTTLEGYRKQLLADPKVDFAALARNHYQDPHAKDNNGDLGWIPRRWLDEAFARAAFALEKGQISEVVETEFGLHLIKAHDRNAGTPTKYSQVRESVRELYSETLWQQIVAEERKNRGAKIEIKLP